MPAVRGTAGQLPRRQEASTTATAVTGIAGALAGPTSRLQPPPAVTITPASLPAHRPPRRSFNSIARPAGLSGALQAFSGLQKVHHEPRWPFICASRHLRPSLSPHPQLVRLPSSIPPTPPALPTRSRPAPPSSSTHTGWPSTALCPHPLVVPYRRRVVRCRRQDRDPLAQGPQSLANTGLAGTLTGHTVRHQSPPASAILAGALTEPSGLVGTHTNIGLSGPFRCTDGPRSRNQPRQPSCALLVPPVVLIISQSRGPYRSASGL